MAKRLNKNDVIRGRIVDEIAKIYGNSVLGFYEGKLRIEVIDEETGEVLQFSVAPTLHKTLVHDEECDPYITTDEKIEIYNASLKKNEEKKTTGKKTKSKAKTEEKKVEAKVEKVSEPVKQDSISEDEKSTLDSLMDSLGL